MYPVSLPLDRVLRAMADLDKQIAEDVRSRGCPLCEGPLHYATWQRKPRGGPDSLPDDCAKRWGLCCGKCRRRRLPRSVLFCGRRGYFKAVMLLVVAARQRQLSTTSLSRLQRLFGVTRKTVARWIAIFLDKLPRSADWQARRGRLTASVQDADVPAALLDLLFDVFADREAALVQACRWVPAL